MRIVGGKDYYDSAMAYGQDTETVFVRHKHSTTDPVVDFPYLGNWIYVPNHYRTQSLIDNKGIRWSINGITVIFAGICYHGIEAHSYSSEIPSSRYFWSHASYSDWLLKKFNRVPVYTHKNDRANPEKAFRSEEVSHNLKKFVEDNKIIVAIANDKNMWINTDGLKDIGFAKVIDPYQAFQTLAMYVGNLPKDGPPMVEIEDENIKLKKHSMDKWSFRKIGKNSKVD